MESQQIIEEYEVKSEDQQPAKREPAESNVYINKSMDGRWIIVKTITTKIYSRKYFEKVLEGN